MRPRLESIFKLSKTEDLTTQNDIIIVRVVTVVIVTVVIVSVVTVVIVTVVIVTVVQVVKVTVVTVVIVTVAEVTVVIVTYVSKKNLTPQQPMRCSQGSVLQFSQYFFNP